MHFISSALENFPGLMPSDLAMLRISSIFTIGLLVELRLRLNIFLKLVTIELYINEDSEQNQKTRHSGEGRNPVWI